MVTSDSVVRRHTLTVISTAFPTWLTRWMQKQKISIWGPADLRDISTPRDETGQKYNFAISLAIPLDPRIMVSIKNGPNQAYADEYDRVNHHINELSEALAAQIKARGFRSGSLAASARTDPISIKGDFPHKTAATRAGLGWIGRHCQLITRSYGSWIRLGTVFTDMELPCGPAIEKNFCGRCMRCVKACPANALKGKAWSPRVLREEILDVRACDQWKKEHYFQFNKGHNCGICSAVCPYGLKVLKRVSGEPY